MTHDVFISYSTVDKTIADSVVAALENNQIRCWYAPRDIEAGDDWGKAISAAIKSCRVFLVIFSENSNRSQRVLDEVNLAISQKVVIVPFRVEDLKPDGALELHLSSRHWLDAFDPSWQEHLKDLVQIVSSVLHKPVTQDQIDVPPHLLKSDLRPDKKKVWIPLLAVAALLITAASLYFFGVLDSLLAASAQPTSTNPPSASPAPSQDPAHQPTPTEETIQLEPEDPCRILYLSDRSGDFNLWLMEPDGGNQTQLSFNQYGDLSGSWSPDGTQIAFDTARDGDIEIFLMNADGTNIRQLTNNEFDDTDVKWSPDGERITFYSNRDGEFLEVYTMEVDGSNLQQITHHGYHSSGSEGHSPSGYSWSPDGSQIAYVSDQDGDLEIVIMAADGSNPYQLTSNDEFQDIAPDWSPDGERILFVSNRFGDYEIFVVNTDGTNLTQLTSNVEVSFNPAWSPDGSKIVFSSNRDGDFEIWIMDADGRNQQQLTFDDSGEFHPAWSPLCR